MSVEPVKVRFKCTNKQLYIEIYHFYFQCLAMTISTYESISASIFSLPRALRDYLALIPPSWEQDILTYLRNRQI